MIEFSVFILKHEGSGSLQWQHIILVIGFSFTFVVLQLVSITSNRNIDILFSLHNVFLEYNTFLE